MVRKVCFTLYEYALTREHRVNARMEPDNKTQIRAVYRAQNMQTESKLSAFLRCDKR